MDEFEESESGTKGATVNLNLTKTEYRLLLDVLYVADWVMHAHHTSEPEETAAHRMVIQKIYSYAEKMGCGDLVQADDRANEYSPTRAYEETSPAHELIDEYDDMTFWDDLMDRLVERDIHENLGEKAYANLKPDEFHELAEPLFEKYAQELENHGIERLRIVEE